MPFITQDDRRVLRRSADSIAEAFGGRVTGETTFRFVQENVTRYVEMLDWEGRKTAVGVHMVADSPTEGDLALTFWGGWGHGQFSPSEFDRRGEVGTLSGYEADGSDVGLMIRHIAEELGYPPPGDPPEEWTPGRRPR